MGHSPRAGRGARRQLARARDAADPLGRLNGAIGKSMFDCIQHGRSRLNIKNRTKIVVLRPLQLPSSK